MIFIDSQHLPIGLHLVDGVAFVWSKSDERTLKHFMFSNLLRLWCDVCFFEIMKCFLWITTNLYVYKYIYIYFSEGTDLKISNYFRADEGTGGLQWFTYLAVGNQRSPKVVFGSNHT